jgi:hypothetical protein
MYLEVLMNNRELPENAVKKVGVFVQTKKVGELVQSFIDDPAVLGVDSIEPGTVNNEWYVVVNYGVLDLASYQTEISRRLYALTNENATFRDIS